MHSFGAMEICPAIIAKWAAGYGFARYFRSS